MPETRPSAARRIRLVGPLAAAAAGLFALPVVAGAGTPSPSQPVAPESKPAAAAATGQAAPDLIQLNDNAALLYWRAWHLMSTQAAKTVEDGLLAFDEAPYGGVKGGGPWEPAMLAALAELRGPLDMIARGTALPRCDFGADWAMGPSTLLPELALLRRSTRLLDADARRLASLGQFEAAADRLIAILRLADHAGQNSPLIGHLVAVAIGALGCNSAQALAQTGRLSAASRDRLLVAVEAMRTSPSFTPKRALQWEQELLGKWLRAELARRPASAFLKDASALLRPDRPLAELPGVPAGDDAAVKAELLRQAETAGALLGEVVAAWDTPEADAVIKQVEARADRLSLTQPMVGLMVAPMSRVRASGQRLAATIGDTAKVLRAAKLAGDPASR